MRTTVLACPECKAQFRPRVEVMSNTDSDWRTCANCGERVDITKLVEMRPVASWVGGGYVAPYAITEYDLGRAGDTGVGTTFTILANVTVPANSTLIVSIMTEDAAGAGLNSISWNGSTLTSWSLASVSATKVLGIYSLGVTTGAISNITADATAAGGLTSYVALVDCLVGNLGASPVFDRQRGVNGNSASPATTATLVTQAVNEIAVAVVAWDTGSVSGTWVGGYTPGQSKVLGSSAIEEGIRNIPDKATYLASKTNCTSSAWGACIVTFRP